MSKEILIPFRLNSDGTIATTEDPGIQAARHVKSLVGTHPGERVMRVAYGVPLQQFLFAPNDPLVASEIKTAIEDALRVWEPGIFVTKITPNADADEHGVASVEVEFIRNTEVSSGLPARVNTATIRVGGEVMEFING